MPNIVADQALLARFAQWLLERTNDTHSANRLLRGVQVRTPAIGRQLKVAFENTGVDGLGHQMLDEFTSTEIESIFRVMGAQPADVVWSRSAKSQRNRRDRLNEVAQTLGVETWTILETAVINGRIRLRVEE